MGRRALTLLEVLVATAIVVLLVGILVPVISRAKIAGERTVAISNTRQIAQAVAIYAASNNDRVPYSDNWLEEVGLTAHGRPLFKDPRFTFTPVPRDPAWYASFTGYALNACLRPTKPYHSVSDAARTVLVAPAVTVYRLTKPGERMTLTYNRIAKPDSLALQWLYQAFPGYEITYEGEFGAERYFDKGVYAFMDGHVKSLHADEFLVPVEDGCGYEGKVQPEDDGIRPTFSFRSASAGP